MYSEDEKNKLRERYQAFKKSEMDDFIDRIKILIESRYEALDAGFEVTIDLLEQNKVPSKEYGYGIRGYILSNMMKTVGDFCTKAVTEVLKKPGVHIMDIHKDGCQCTDETCDA